MKNNIIKLIVSSFILIFYSSILKAENVVINAQTVDIKENGNLILASGTVVITDQQNITINGDMAKYNKIDQTLEIEGNVIFVDKETNYEAKSDRIIFYREKKLINSFNNTKINLLDKNNQNTTFKIEGDNSVYDGSSNILEINKNVILIDPLNKFKLYSNKIVYNKNESILTSIGKTKIDYENEFLIITEDISFNNNEKIFLSQKNTTVEDLQKNIFTLSSFKFNLKDKIVKSKNLKLLDTEGNLLKVTNGYVNLNSKEIIGSDYSFEFENGLLGNKENNPRLIGRYILTNQNETQMKKSSFTTCKKIDGKCPAWSISADEVSHQKEKKRISYKNAWLKVYDKPIAYFPYFFHPDPTVDRQSGFLFPQFINSSNLGFSTQIPYFKAIDIDKDITISPRVYTNNNLFLQTEYRQVFENSKLTTDLSFNKKDKVNSHFFANLVNNKEDSSYELKLETVSHSDYLKKYNIKSPLINNDSVLNSFFTYDKLGEDYTFSTSLNIYEDLSKEKNDRYEYSFPEYEYNKVTTLNNNFFNSLKFKSTGNYRNFETNINEADVVNDFVFSSNNQDQLKNLDTNFSLLLRNLNSYGDLSKTYKNGEDYKILSSALFSLKYPLIKKNENQTKYLAPIAALRFSPNKGLNLKNEQPLMNFENLFLLDRVSSKTIESGESATFGVEYKSTDNFDKEILNLGLGINLRNSVDEDLPISTSLGQKTSDIIGYSGVNLTENFSLNYNFIIDQNFNDMNFSLLSLEYANNIFKTSFEYLEKSNTLGDESYLNNQTKLDLNETNSISFKTNKNIDKNLTDYYDLIYSYKNDCLEASVVYNKQFYNDSDINSSKNIFFKISFIPFGTINTVNINE